MSTAFERLCRWRDVGDVSLTYTAGDKEFGDDVNALLAEREDLLAALRGTLEQCVARHDAEGSTPTEKREIEHARHAIRKAEGKP